MILSPAHHTVHTELAVSYCANVGQQGEDYEAITKKAKDCGASKVYIEDLCEEFVTDFVFEAVKANAQYEGRYLLGTRQAAKLPCCRCRTGVNPDCVVLVGLCVVLTSTWSMVDETSLV